MNLLRNVTVFLIQYWTNPYKNSKIHSMTRDNFWNNKFIEKLPYVKGFVYAIYLVQTYGNQFLERYKRIIVNHYETHTIINNKLLKSDLNDNNFNKYIIDGFTIKIKNDYSKKVKSVYFGFDLEAAIHKKIISNLDKKSETYKNAIRNGNIEELHINYSIGTMMIKQNNKRVTIDLFVGPYINIPQIKKLII